MGESDVDKQRDTVTSDDPPPVAQAGQPDAPSHTTSAASTDGTSGAKRRVWRRLQRLLRDDPEFNPTNSETDGDPPLSS